MTWFPEPRHEDDVSYGMEWVRYHDGYKTQEQK